MEHNTDKYFREGLAGHRIEPPPHLWQQIAGAAVAPHTGVNGRHRNKTTFWWWSMPVVILLTGLGYLALAPAILSEEPIPFPAGEGAQISFVEYNIPLPMPLRKGEPDNEVSLPEVNTLANLQPSPAMAPATTPATITAPVTASAPATATAPTAEPVPVIAPATIPATTEAHAQTMASATTPATIPQPLPEAVTSATTAPTGHEDPPPHTLISEPAATLTPPATEKISPVLPAVSHIVTEVLKEETSAPQPNHIDDVQDTSRGTHQLPPHGTVEAPKKLFTHDLRTEWLIYTGVQLYRLKEPWNSEWHSPPETDLLYRLRYRRMSLTTGPGIGMLNQSHNTAATLRKVDTVGYYQYVSGIGFQPVYSPIDSSVTGYIPVNIVTITKPQLDTSYHTTSLKVNYRTTWFRVPLIIGYDLYHTEKWTLSAQTGLIWYRRMSERQTIPVLPPEETLVALHEPLFSFTDHFWLYQYGINVRYDINPNWYAEAAVARRQFLKPWFRPASTAPVSVMVSTSLGFRL